MSVVTRAGAYALADPNTARGAGETSVNSPLRSNLDYQTALGDTAEQAGNAIVDRIEAVVDFIRDSTGIDLSSFGALLEGLSGVLGTGPIGDFLTNLENALSGIDLSSPGGVLGAIVGTVQPVIDALVGGLGGGSTTGNDPASIAVALIAKSAQIPVQILSQLLGSVAALQAQLNGVQNQVSTGSTSALTDDFATSTVAGYTNIVGVIAKSARGPYVQTPAFAAAYRNTGAATDKHGAVVVLDGKMRGTIRVAICSDTTMASYAALEVYCGFGGDAIRLVTGSAPRETAIRRQVDYSGAQNLQNTNVVEVWFDPAANTFHVLLNGVEIMPPWVDVEGAVAHGTSNRRVVIVSNADDSPDDGEWGPGIRKVTVYDK